MKQSEYFFLYFYLNKNRKNCDISEIKDQNSTPRKEQTKTYCHISKFSKDKDTSFTQLKCNFSGITDNITNYLI